MDALFALLPVAVLPWWLSMLLFPEGPATRRLVTSPWPFVVLGAVHLVLLLAAVIGGGAPASLDARALAGTVSRGWGFLAVWSHVVTMNLFAGVWIFRDARFHARVPRLELMLAWTLGPVGLATYLWRRRRWSTAGPVRTVN